MTPDPLGTAAVAYTGPRRDRREATGPLTRYGRDAASPQTTDRAPVTPDRP